MTLTASTSILMSSVHRRWLTVREMLTIQGFPVDTRFTYGAPCSSYALRDFQRRRGLSHHPWPSRHALCSQAGNSIHTSVSGVLILFILTQIIFDNGILDVQTCMLRRSLVVEPSKGMCHQVDNVQPTPFVRNRQTRAIGCVEDASEDGRESKHRRVQ